MIPQESGCVWRILNEMRDNGDPFADESAASDASRSALRRLLTPLTYRCGKVGVDVGVAAGAGEPAGEDSQTRTHST
jgi:hypothetical protein